MRAGIVSLFLFLSCSRTFAAVRVALVSNGTGESVKQATALATVELSGAKDVQLVDRTAIDSILREQKVSLSGLVESSHMLEVGKLFKTDLFALVEADKDGSPLGIVIFDTGSGIRLCDLSLDPKPDVAAKAIADAVRTAAEKDRNIGQGLKLVGFLPVRNADMPRDRDTFCDMVRVLVERELTAAPGLAVLERIRLEQVNKERELPTSAQNGKLLASMVTVQLELSHDGIRGLKASAMLANGQGASLDKLVVTSGSSSAAELAEMLRDALTKYLRSR